MERLSDMKVLVIGETCKDVFIYGDVNRLSPEAPIPVIEPKRKVINRGMAENVKLNINALGLQADLITNSEEIIKTRYVDDSYNYILLRVDDNDKVSNINIETLPNLETFDLVVLQITTRDF